MGQGRIAALLTSAIVTTAALAGCSVGDGSANEEVYDFRETTTSEVRGGTPYDTYVLLSEQAGIDFLDLREAETRAQELCADPEQVSGAVEERSVQDAALIAAFCPGGASDDSASDSGDGG